MAFGASASPETPRTDGAGVSGCELRTEGDKEERRKFADLRGMRWRIDLGILPALGSTEELRRVTANYRRRYAALRRSLLVDPPRKGVTKSPEVVIDDPLSQNPDSMWGQFFRNAELEKMVDQDLSRLYPAHGSYFQTPSCQSMLRRILLLWCLRHPECGYRQGMHELLAPFLYVLHVDIEHLSELRKLYKDQFTENFEESALYDRIYGSGIENVSDSKGNGIDSHTCPKLSSFDELDPEVQTIISLSDAYGAEGELGIILSHKFMEHDAYSLFDALMSGSQGTVAMADYFTPTPAVGSHTGLPPIIEASSALYHLLSIADSSLHSHLIELGVEPQYFALRWLRVLFGREFTLANLLLIWDEIFASDNYKLNKGTEEAESTYAVLTSPRGAFIASLAISMILHLRSSLLASENATSCLQRLLNFPENVSLKKLITKAKSFRLFAIEANTAASLTSFKGSHHRSKSMFVAGNNVPSNPVSPAVTLSVVPESYWEEKWRFIQKAEELSKSGSGKKVSSNKKRWSDKVKFSLSRAESDPSHLKLKNGVKEQSSSVRQNLLADLSSELGLDKDDSNTECNGAPCPGNDSERLEREKRGKDCVIEEERCSSDRHQCSVEEKLFSTAATNFCSIPNEPENDTYNTTVEIERTDENCTNIDEEAFSYENMISKENDFLSSASASPCSRPDGHETDSERSSVASNSSVVDNYDEYNDGKSEAAPEVAPSPLSENSVATPPVTEKKNDVDLQSASKLKDRRPSGKFPWFWRFGRNVPGEETSVRGSLENLKSPAGVVDSPKAASGDKNSVDSNKGSQHHKETSTLRNLGQSMVENIQVLETVLRPEHGCVTSFENVTTSKVVDQGPLDVVAALRELRKISNLLSECDFFDLPIHFFADANC